jgi:hypothetical protein
MNGVLIKEAAVAYELLPATGPSADPCLCGAAHPAHSGAANNGGNPQTGCRRYRRDAAYVLAERAREAEQATFNAIVQGWQDADYPRPGPRKGGWSVGPSDIGRCRRQIQYRERPPEGLILDPVNQGPAYVGTLIHDAFLRAVKQRAPWRLIEHEVFVPGLDRPGRVDDYDPISKITDDLKTMGENAYERLGNLGVDINHWKQGAIYAYGLEATQGLETKLLKITAVRRSNGDSEVFHKRYDADEARSAVGELRAINTALDMGMELPRDGRGPTTDKICSDYCPFLSHCWSVKAAEAARRSPESYTLLGENVDPDEVAWAAGTVRGWQDAVNEADKEASRSKSWLVGVPDGTYGEHTVRERSKASPLYKEYHRLVQEACARGASPQEIAAIEVPTSNTTHPEVKRVRAAKRRTTPAPETKETTP